jgi:signal transduction histidine kinase
MLRQLLGPGIVLSVRSDGEAAPVRMDRSQFELMLLNIASNARDALCDTGRFEIDIDRDGDRVRIRLRDNGSGMRAEVAARIFEPFFSTKPADSGTGLGLAVVNELVTEAGGGIGVESICGEGTTFLISLPCARQDSACIPGHEPP